MPKWITRELRKLQQKGLLRAKRTANRLKGQILRAYRIGQYEVSFIPQLYAELVPIAADAMTVAHFAGIKRSVMMLPKEIKFSLRGDVQEVLKQQIDLEEIDLVRQMYSLEATRALGIDARAAERRIEQTMLEVVASGVHVREGVKVLSKKIDGLGISTHRLETIFRTQTQLAYGAARWNADQNEAVQEILWGYEYATVGDDRVRDEHEVLDGTKLPKEHPFWQTWWPPNGWNCRCQPLPIFEPEEMKFPPIDINPEPGFDRNPAHTLSGTRFSLIVSKDAPAWLQDTMAEVRRLYTARNKFPKGSEKWKELNEKRLIARKQVTAQKKDHPEWFGGKKITTIKTPPTIKKPKREISSEKTARLREELEKLKAKRIAAEKELAETKVRVTKLKVQELKPGIKFDEEGSLDDWKKQARSQLRIHLDTQKLKPKDKKRALVVLESLNDVSSRFPEISKRMHERSALPSVHLHSRTTLPGNAGGRYRPGPKQIDLAVKIRKNSNPSPRFKDYTIDESLTGFTRHEFGHHVQSTLLDHKERREWELLANKKLTARVSEYAETDRFEAFAESFSAYTHPNYKRGSLPGDIEKFFDKTFKTEAVTKPKSKVNRVRKTGRSSISTAKVLKTEAPSSDKLVDWNPENKEWVGTLSEEEAFGLADYWQAGEQSEDLDDALKKAPINEGTFYRGMAFDEFGGSELKIGGQMEFSGVASTSLNSAVAEDFAIAGRRDRRTSVYLFEIEGKSAIDLRHVSEYTNQKEFVFQEGTQFKIKSIKKWKNPDGITFTRVVVKETETVQVVKSRKVDAGSKRTITALKNTSALPSAIKKNMTAIDKLVAKDDAIADAIVDYTGEDYVPINDALRSRTISELNGGQKNTIRNLDKLLVQELDESVTVYRGSGANSGPRLLKAAQKILDKGEGGYLLDRAYLSTSVNPAVATEFSEESRVIFQIETKWGGFVEDFAVGHDAPEAEFLLHRTSKLKIDGIDKEVMIGGKEYTVIRTTLLEKK